jgi:hypothetical protein
VPMTTQACGMGGTQSCTTACHWDVCMGEMAPPPPPPDGGM